MSWKTIENEKIEDVHQAIRDKNQEVIEAGGMLVAYIGSDGHNLGAKKGTSFVQCVALHVFNDCLAGTGGRVFYIRHVERYYNSMQQKLLREVEIAINLAQAMEPLFTELGIPWEIHLDVNSDPGINNHNKSNVVHKAARGWAEAHSGWVVKTKPDAFVASIVADRHTRGVKSKKGRPCGKRKKAK